MQTFLLAVVLLTLVALFWRRYLETVGDAEVSPVNFSLSEWFKHSAVEMAFDIVFFVALCLGLNIDFIINSAEIGTNTPAEATLATIGGAIATGTAIYKGVQMVVLPLFNLVTGGKTARKKLRTKIASAQQ